MYNYHPEKSPNRPPVVFFFFAPYSTTSPALAPPAPPVFRYLPTPPASSPSACLFPSPLSPSFVPSHVVLSFSLSFCASARRLTAASDWSCRARRACSRVWYASNGSCSLVDSLSILYFEMNNHGRTR